jgi:hypothetical protein
MGIDQQLIDRCFAKALVKTEAFSNMKQQMPLLGINHAISSRNDEQASVIFAFFF